MTHQLPAVEVHAAQFAVIGLGNVDVQRLALVNVGAAIGCHFQDGFLRDLPHGFVQLLQISWDFLDGLFLE